MTGNELNILKPDQEKVKHLAEELDLSPVLARILVNRGIAGVEQARQFIFGGIESLHDPFDVSDMEKAADIILKHVKNGSNVLIHGDYDADGVTSTAILKMALARLGVEAEYYIPDRFDEGYGFAPESISKAQELNVKLIITVDCGSSNAEEVAAAKDAGIDVVVTDHHEVPETAPPADAFVNLKRPGETYPFRELSGAGIALKLVQAMYIKEGRDDWTDFLDLAAIGTVADVVPLVGENRVIVKQGLKLLSKRKRPGIAHLLALANVQREKLSPWDISFIIAPRINAAGRMADAVAALKFLLEEDPDRSKEMVQHLIKLNEDRQKVETVIKEEIEQMLNNDPSLLSHPVWVFESRQWHQGVIGIVASRFCHAFDRPVYLVCIDENGMGRGSARSRDNYSVYDALEGAKNVLEHYGGHRLAGGFTLKEDNINLLREAVSREDFFQKGTAPMNVDMVLDRRDINLSLARDLETLAPFGEGNPKPLFLSTRLKFQSVTTVGSTGQHLKLWISNGDKDVKAIAFGKGEQAGRLLYNDLNYSILYNLDVDFWRNQEEASIKVQEILEPDNDCMRVISGLEEVAIKNGDSDCGMWRLVDARAVVNRWKYIKNLYRGRRKCLVFTRNRKQMKVLMENLQGEKVKCIDLTKDQPGDVYGGYVALTPLEVRVPAGDFQEILFYHPPFDWKHFKKGVFESVNLKRVHLLFGDEDVLREETNQRVLSPDRERLLMIYQGLRKITDKNVPFKSFPKVLASVIKDDYVQPITVNVAMKIFSEIGLVSVNEAEGEIRFNECEKQELESSETYVRQMKKREGFEELKELLTFPFIEELKKRIPCSKREGFKALL